MVILEAIGFLFLNCLTVYFAVLKALHDDEVAHTKPRIEGKRWDS